MCLVTVLFFLSNGPSLGNLSFFFLSDFWTLFVLCWHIFFFNVSWPDFQDSRLLRLLVSGLWSGEKYPILLLQQGTRVWDDTVFLQMSL